MFSVRLTSIPHNWTEEIRPLTSYWPAAVSGLSELRFVSFHPLLDKDAAQERVKKFNSTFCKRWGKWSDTHKLTPMCWNSHERITLVACFGRTPRLFLVELSSWLKRFKSWWNWSWSWHRQCCLAYLCLCHENIVSYLCLLYFTLIFAGADCKWFQHPLFSIIWFFKPACK